jgi:hypothetical protein
MMEASSGTIIWSITNSKVGDSFLSGFGQIGHVGRDTLRQSEVVSTLTVLSERGDPPQPTAGGRSQQRS